MGTINDWEKRGLNGITTGEGLPESSITATKPSNMVQVKLFDTGCHEHLEEDINAFLKEYSHRIQVKDISYNVNISPNHCTRWSAMVTYESHE